MQIVSRSKSSKTDDKEVMWKKLSTLPVSQSEKDMLYFRQTLGRAFRGGFEKGAVSVIAAKSGKRRGIKEDPGPGRG